MREKSTAVIVQ